MSQCARFAHSPRHSHEVALKRIGQFLKFTANLDLILRPTGVLDIDAYCDADFAGLWSYEDSLDPSCVKSQTGFVICLSSCPIICTLHDGSRVQRFVLCDAKHPSFSGIGSFCDSWYWNR